MTIVDLGNISRAVDSLGMPRTTVSKRLTRLEQTVGHTLLNRSSHAINLTPAGRIYFDHGKRAITLLDNAQQLVREMSQVPSGTIRVHAQKLILPSLPAFSEQYPDARVVLSTSD